MADEPEPAAPKETAAPKRRRRAEAGATDAAPTEAKPTAGTAPAKASGETRGQGAEAPTGGKPASTEKKTEEPAAPRRASLSPELSTLLSTRRLLDLRRPVFGRQAAHRYARIGRDGAWRRPRGLQSKQRRHYGYRPRIVRVGYRSPAAVRGLTPAGFRPVIVRTRDDLDGLDARRDAAVIARTVGTRRRLVLEEEARRLGIRVLNPIVKGQEEH